MTPLTESLVPTETPGRTTLRLDQIWMERTVSPEESSAGKTRFLGRTAPTVVLVSGRSRVQERGQTRS